jgi:hypothetical protein
VGETGSVSRSSAQQRAISVIPNDPVPWARVAFDAAAETARVAAEMFPSA